MRQSRAMSFLKAIANVVIGYILAVCTQMLVFPWFGLNPMFSDALGIGALFTSVSLLRSYVLRRLFIALGS